MCFITFRGGGGRCPWFIIQQKIHVMEYAQICMDENLASIRFQINLVFSCQILFQAEEQAADLMQHDCKE